MKNFATLMKIIEARITDSQKEIEGFINNQKSVNTTKTMTDMTTLFHYMKEKGLNSENIQSLPAAELDHLLSKFFYEYPQEKRRRVQTRHHIWFSAKRSKVFNRQKVSTKHPQGQGL